MADILNVLYLTSEVFPFSKTGGLADVSHFLPLALRDLGFNILVVTPRYRDITPDRYAMQRLDVSLRVPMFFWDEQAAVYQHMLGNRVPVFFIEHNAFFDRPGIYNENHTDYPDNLKRYAFLTRAALQLARLFAFKVDIVHANDWQTALAPMYIKMAYNHDPLLAAAGSLLTIHNLGYQGLFAKESIYDTGFGWDLFKPEFLEYYDQINLLKGGIQFADIINTVSRRYAHEIQTPQFGFHLDGVLRSRSTDLYGIVNGADYDHWNPETDRLIPAVFSRDDLSGKQICKQALQQRFHLQQRPGAPVIGVVSRLVRQKGFDLLAQVLDTLMEHDVQLAILGTGESWANDFFYHLPGRYPGRVGSMITYDEQLAHLVEAGADFFLMPSRYEPCGLNQMYSLRYGTLPIVRATGGLDDTIDDYHETHGLGTGFKFYPFSPEALLDVLKKVIYTWWDRKHHIQAMRKRAMAQRFSWAHTAEEYLKLYAFAKEKKLKGWY